MSTNHSHTTHLPLDSLIERLELAGYAVTPRQRLQMWQVLDHFGIEALEQPEQLKHRLCPLLAGNAAEQAQLYTLFDQYLSDMRQYAPPPPVPPPPRWHERLPAWAWAALLLALLATGTLALRHWIRHKEAAVRSPLAEHPAEVVLGQPFDAYNRSVGYDSSAARFRWELLDQPSGALEQSAESYHWETSFTAPGGSPDKQLRLIAIQGGRADTSHSSLRLLCPEPPAYSPILAPADTAAGAAIAFRLPEPEQPGLRYEWDFGDGSKAQGYAPPSHTYAAAGGYQVRLAISDPSAAGYCVQRLQHNISIQDTSEQYAFLAYLAMPLDDTPSRLLHFGLGAWLLLALLILLSAWYWRRWLRQPPPPEEAPERRQQAQQARFEHADRAPYRIPFRPQDGLLRPGPELYRLAQALRLRQEGLRLELDVPASLRQTIEAGGFPTLRFRRDSLPPDYLFLIDEQAPHSHQAQIYRYLVDFLRGQDVHLEAFWYKKTPARLWNAQHPNGLSLDQVQRLYPHYRLLVLGDGHALLDPLAREQHRVQPALAAAYRRWKSRLLLSPLPAQDWTYREAALYELLAVFPSGASGVQAAMAYLEAGHEEEDERARPGFPAWQAAHAQPPPPPTANYRQWERLEAYQAYFQGRPELLRWLCAALVWPAPNWPLTLAIGRAIGAPVTFDHLLLLARVPCLQGAPLPHRLRLQLLALLDADTERLARAALAEELHAAAPAVEHGHAKRELQAGLVLQEFLLEPEDEGRREDLRYLLQAGILGKRERAELEQAWQRQQGGALSLEEALRRPAEPGAPPPRRALNADFYRALAAAALLLLLGLLLGALDGSERLSRLLLHAPEDGFFLRSSPALDSALLYHNQAIADWDSLRRRPAPPAAAELEAAAAAFARARALRGGDYPLATANAARNRFHQGLLRYHDFLQDRDTAALSQAEAFFQQALAMAAADTALASAVPLHVRHALGLIAHCRQPRQPAAFEIFYALQDEGFFDTLRLQPNLRTLLFPDREGEAVRHPCLPAPQLERLSADTLCPGAALRLRLAPLAGADFFVLRWGDGQADTLPASTASQEISHVFSLRSGAISVRVLAFGECDSIGPVFNDAALRALVLAPPIARMQQSVQRGCPPLEVRFQALGRADEYRWDFGDGQQSSAPSPTVTYAEPGRYTVRLILRNACGADTLTLANAVEVLTAAECRTTFDLDDFQVLGAGRGLPGARIAAGPPEGFAPDRAPYQLIADAEGRFRLAALPMGTAALRFYIQAPGYMDTTFTYRLIDELLRVELRPQERPTQTTPPPPPPPDDLIAKLEADMVPVAGGTFTMGCENAKRDGNCDDSEKPSRQVRVPAFSIGRYEVTQAQWRAVMGSDPPELYNKGCDDCPVEGVSWDDIQEFLQNLNKRTGKRYRLPSEAEWEYAARGGSRSEGFLYSGGYNLDEVGWYSENSREGNTHGEERTTRPVGQKRPNELGLYDMSGNVWEWVEDCWYDNYNGAPRDGSARRGEKGQQCSDRVVRGGSWRLVPQGCRAAYRGYWLPTYRDDFVGFRLAF